MKKLLAIHIALFVIICAVFSGCDGNAVNTGEVSFTVLDGLNSLPIENARIVIPEAEQELITDKNGKTGEFTVPILCNDYCAVGENEGMFTVLAFCEGYNDYALFYARLAKDEERNMKIYLFKLDTPLSNGMPLSTVESPDSEITLNIIKNYK